MPCRALPRRAVPRLAVPGLVSPCQATPSRASPCLAQPSRARPRHGQMWWEESNLPEHQHHKSLPSQATPCRAQPSHALPRPASPRPATDKCGGRNRTFPSASTTNPRIAWPCHATSCRAEPSPAMPGPAVPCRARPRHAVGKCGGRNRTSLSASTTKCHARSNLDRAYRPNCGRNVPSPKVPPMSRAIFRFSNVQ